jgi:alkyldihydroxyacetonephosphate synthase
VRRYLSWRGVAQNGVMLLVGAAGDARHIRATMRSAAHTIHACGGVALGASPGRHWLADRFRHPYLRDALLDHGIATDTLETAAPWAQVASLSARVSMALTEGLSAAGERVAALCHVSHPYPDGASLYFTFFFRCPRDPDEAIGRWARLKRAATDAIVAGGGTLSHHHGIGAWHAPWLEREVGPDGVRVLAAAARTLDPDGILNPHVLLDPTDRLEA